MPDEIILLKRKPKGDEMQDGVVYVFWKNPDSWFDYSMSYATSSNPNGGPLNLEKPFNKELQEAMPQTKSVTDPILYGVGTLLYVAAAAAFDCDDDETGFDDMNAASDAQFFATSSYDAPASNLRPALTNAILQITSPTQTSTHTKASPLITTSNSQTKIGGEKDLLKQTNKSELHVLYAKFEEPTAASYPLNSTKVKTKSTSSSVSNEEKETYVYWKNREWACQQLNVHESDLEAEKSRDTIQAKVARTEELLSSSPATDSHRNKQKAITLLREYIDSYHPAAQLSNSNTSRENGDNIKIEPRAESSSSSKPPAPKTTLLSSYTHSNNQFDNKYTVACADNNIFSSDISIKRKSSNLDTSAQAPLISYNHAADTITLDPNHTTQDERVALLLPMLKARFPDPSMKLMLKGGNPALNQPLVEALAKEGYTNIVIGQKKPISVPNATPPTVNPTTTDNTNSSTASSFHH